GRRTATARRRRPSLPLLAGAAAVAVAVGGVMATGATPTTLAAGDSRVPAASALSGHTGGGTGRVATVSRDGGRGDTPQDQADEVAQQRAAALDDLDKRAASENKDLNSNKWVLPIEAGVYHLTARFGDVSGLWASVHTGLDFAAPYGTPIHAVASGTVTSVGYDGSYGNKTVVTLADGTEIWYCHQSQFAVSVGDTVTSDEVIGYVGATGNVTGPHVHIEVRPGGGDPVDPDPAFKEHGVNPDANQ
ncbi:MAG: M23 family metallopeptidase, partial [Nocardioides sp.]|uniref:M23 family metallopeptidase n=1 Tax=Nocardioides sp. TaxID=35761 RepID=UPI0039E53DB4